MLEVQIKLDSSSARVSIELEPTHISSLELGSLTALSSAATPFILRAGDLDRDEEDREGERGARQRCITGIWGSQGFLLFGFASGAMSALCQSKIAYHIKIAP